MSGWLSPEGTQHGLLNEWLSLIWFPKRDIVGDCMSTIFAKGNTIIDSKMNHYVFIFSLPHTISYRDVREQEDISIPILVPV